MQTNGPVIRRGSDPISLHVSFHRIEEEGEMLVRATARPSEPSAVSWAGGRSCAGVTVMITTSAQEMGAQRSILYVAPS